MHDVLFLEKVFSLDHVDQSFDVDTVVAFADIHCRHEEFRTSLGTPLVQKTRVFVENLVIVEHAESFGFWWLLAHPKAAF